MLRLIGEPHEVEHRIDRRGVPQAPAAGAGGGDASAPERRDRPGDGEVAAGDHADRAGRVDPLEIPHQFDHPRGDRIGRVPRLALLSAAVLIAPLLFRGPLAGRHQMQLRNPSGLLPGGVGRKGLRPPLGSLRRCPNSGLVRGDPLEDPVDERQHFRRRPPRAGERFVRELDAAPSLLEAIRQMLEDRRVAAPPPVDRLLQVAHREEAPASVAVGNDLRGERAKRHPLLAAGVLELVEQEMLDLGIHPAKELRMPLRLEVSADGTGHLGVGGRPQHLQQRRPTAADQIHRPPRRFGAAERGPLKLPCRPPGDRPQDRREGVVDGGSVVGGLARVDLGDDAALEERRPLRQHRRLASDPNRLERGPRRRQSLDDRLLLREPIDLAIDRRDGRREVERRFRRERP